MSPMMPRLLHRRCPGYCTAPAVPATTPPLLFRLLPRLCCPGYCASAVAPAAIRRRCYPSYCFCPGCPGCPGCYTPPMLPRLLLLSRLPRLSRLLYAADAAPATAVVPAAPVVPAAIRRRCCPGYCTANDVQTTDCCRCCSGYCAATAVQTTAPPPPLYRLLLLSRCLVCPGFCTPPPLSRLLRRHCCP